VPYLFIPGYIACAWAWFLRAGETRSTNVLHQKLDRSRKLYLHAAPDQTLLQALILPIFVLPTLLPTPLLEPRYFVIPYILLRAQIVDIPSWAVVVETLWYAAINTVTMAIFLFAEREGVGRFMW
jgi:alpha-1,2-glucosyltransferase